MKSSLRGLSTIDPFIGGILAEVDKQFGRRREPIGSEQKKMGLRRTVLTPPSLSNERLPEVCCDPRCPVTGSHNTDECQELIRQAEFDGR